MGHWDRKNYIIKIGIRDCCTDYRYIKFMQERNYIYTIEEVKDFIQSTTPQYNPLAEKIVRFFITYNRGQLLPNKYSDSEPINLSFNKDNIVNPIAILSYTGGTLFMKRNRCYSAVIENESYNFVWENKKSFKPKRELPEYMVNIRILFSKQSKPKMDFLQKLTNDLASYFETDCAKIIDQEIASTLPPLYEKDPAAVIYDVNWK